jgi:RNA recognition motif-containing protein
MKIFVGNLAPKTVEDDLLHAFQVFGDVKMVNIAKTLADGLSREFGFVDMDTELEGHAAIAGLNGTTLHAHRLRVSPAKKRDR